MAWRSLAPVYLGWALGSNDASNVFGTAVSTRMVRFGTAAAVTAGFVVLGAWLEGAKGMETLGGITALDEAAAVSISIAAAVTVTALTLLKLPISTSQAVVGAILGHGLVAGSVDASPLAKVGVCWIGTPIGAMVVGATLYGALAPLANRYADKIVPYDVVMRAGLVAAGAYGAYALGANNAANVTGVFVGAGLLDTRQAALLAGASIALGVVTFSRGVMQTVGRGIIRMNAYGALVVVLAEAITVHFYAWVGVPVSTSQAVVGAVLGVGLVRSIETVRLRAVYRILSGWFLTPTLAGLIAAAIHVARHLEYRP